MSRRPGFPAHLSMSLSHASPVANGGPDGPSRRPESPGVRAQGKHPVPGYSRDTILSPAVRSAPWGNRALGSAAPRLRTAGRRVDDLAEEHPAARAVGGMDRDADGPLPDCHRPGPGRRRRHLPAVGHMLFLPRHFSGGRPDVAVSARRSPGPLAAGPAAGQLRGPLRVPGHRLRPGHHSHALLVGPARRFPDRSLVLGVRRTAARRGHRRQVRCGSRRAVGRCPLRDRPWRRPRCPDRSGGGGQGMAINAAGRDGARAAALPRPWPCWPRSAPSSPAERRASSRTRTPAASRSNR